MSPPSPSRKIVCPSCAAVYTVPANLPARTVKCRVCHTSFALGGQTMQTPEPRATMTAPRPSADPAATKNLSRPPAPVRSSPATIRTTPAPAPAPIAAGLSDAPEPTVKKGFGGLLLAAVVQSIRFFGIALLFLLTLTGRGIRNLYVAGTGPDRKKYLPRIAAGAVITLLLVIGGIYGLPVLFSTTSATESTEVAARPTTPAEPTTPAVKPTTPADTTPPIVKSTPPVDPPVIKPAPPDEPRGQLDPTPRQLLVRYSTKQPRAVRFNANVKFNSKDKTGTDHVFNAKFITHFKEHTKSVRETEHRVTQRLEYQDCTLDFDYDNDKDLFHFPDQEEIVKNVAHLASIERLHYPSNRHIDYEFDLSDEVKEANLRRSYAHFHSQVNMLLQLVSIPMPSGSDPDQMDPVKPGATWSHSGEMSMASGNKGGGSTTSQKFTYTYLGFRKNNGREEALINVKVELRTKGTEALTGDGEGEAVLDVRSGVITSVKLNLKMDTDTSMFVVDGDSKATGTVKLELRRELPAAP